MDRSHLKLRDNWQTLSRQSAELAEIDFAIVFDELLFGTEYELIKRPKDFSNIYYGYPLLERDKGQIYDPPTEYRHGFVPDFAISNSLTKKRIYIEIKRQDGWVEGKPRRAGRGNAHERLCRYFTPGLMKILYDKSKIRNALPFWVVFRGDITRDPCRVREITCWFGDHTDNFFFWRDGRAESLILHFIACIVPHLD